MCTCKGSKFVPQLRCPPARQEYYKPKVSVNLDGWPLEFDWLDGQTFDAGSLHPAFITKLITNLRYKSFFECRQRCLHLLVSQSRQHHAKLVSFTLGRIKSLQSRAQSAKQAVVKELRIS